MADPKWSSDPADDIPPVPGAADANSNRRTDSAGEQPPPSPSGNAAGRGVPFQVRFRGILEGRCASPEGLTAALTRLNAVELVRGDLEIDGPRFSYAFDEEWVSGTRCTQERKDQWVSRLGEFVAESDPDHAVESTLNCQELFANEVVETLFGVQGRELRTLQRRRRLESRDLQARPERGSRPLGSMSRRRAGMIVVVLVGAVSLFAWQRGLVDRLLAADPKEIALSAGDVGEVLEMSIEGSWGDYLVTLKRGAQYPSSVAIASEWEESATTVEERALRRAVTQGGTLFVHLTNRDGALLEARPVELTRLIHAPEGVARVALRGHRDASRIRLALVAEGATKLPAEAEAAPPEK